MAIYGLLALLGIYVFTRRKYTIYNDGKKYLTRYYFFGKWFRRVFNRNLFIHHFHASDSREYHSHRWIFGYSLILWGGYIEHRRKLMYYAYETESLGGKPVWSVSFRKEFKPWSVNRLDHDWYHRTELLDEKRGCWTLFWAGPFASSDWAFRKEDGSLEYAKQRFGGNREDLSDD